MNVERHGTGIEWGPLLPLADSQKQRDVACRVCVRHGGVMKVRTGGPDRAARPPGKGEKGRGQGRRKKKVAKQIKWKIGDCGWLDGNDGWDK